jgi:hypothetical protein
MRRTTLLYAGLVLAAASIAGFSASPQGVRDGVFTADQAARGKQEYTLNCSRCHNVALVGSERGPAVKGQAFLKKWEQDNLAGLFIKIRDTMPEGGPGVVNDAAKIDILTYILLENGFPAGARELRPDLPSLDAIALSDQTESTGPPNFALVRVVGCLAQDRNNRWILTNATEPVATRDETAAPESLDSAWATPLGSEAFELISISPPFKVQANQKVEARGLLYRAPGDSALNLISIESVDSNCEK